MKHSLAVVVQTRIPKFQNLELADGTGETFHRYGPARPQPPITITISIIILIVVGVVVDVVVGVLDAGVVAVASVAVVSVAFVMSWLLFAPFWLSWCAMTCCCGCVLFCGVFGFDVSNRRLGRFDVRRVCHVVAVIVVVVVVVVVRFSWRMVLCRFGRGALHNDVLLSQCSKHPVGTAQQLPSPYCWYYCRRRGCRRCVCQFVIVFAFVV